MNLVTDRTESDVLQKNEKGTYNYSDLNRVESAVKQILSYLPDLDIDLQLETKTDWALTEEYSENTWPTVAQMERYLHNVVSLCDAIKIKVPSLPTSMQNLTWSGANEIEKALNMVYVRIMSIINYFQYSGEFFAGEETGL